MNETKARSTHPHGDPEVNVVVGDKDAEKRLLGLSAGESWSRMAARVRTQIEENKWPSRTMREPSRIPSDDVAAGNLNQS